MSDPASITERCHEGSVEASVALGPTLAAGGVGRTRDTAKPGNGMKWENQNTDDQYQNLRRNLRYGVVERFGKSKDGSQCGVTLSQIRNRIVNKNTPATVDACESSVNGEVIMGHSSLNCYIRVATGHKHRECHKYAEKPYTHKQCERGLSPLLSNT
ncbi:hypothetical protein P7K49_028496 [Saguinus oedipus]|uniref:Uncharacterized protein n=1 Tax=Saguinus oedipus TaxID=9490 RepID=A0ABQ9U4H2_SAGOE|nr:hypothetical protein P7K49_028496 [Saguinus oedipus]